MKIDKIDTSWMRMNPTRRCLIAGVLFAVAALTFAQVRGPAKVTDRLTAPIATIEPTAPGSHSYELALIKDEKLCRHMLILFNDDLKKYGYEQYAMHEEFRKIPWRSARIYSQVDERTDYLDAQVALFDINNDGVHDFVVRWAASLGGALNDGLYVLDGEVAKREKKLVNRELFESKNKINISGWAYKLDSRIGERAEVFGILEPFIFHEQVYIYMRPLFELTSASKPTFSVIARYGGGQIVANDRSGVMNDLCYFKRVRKAKQPIH